MICLAYIREIWISRDTVHFQRRAQHNTQSLITSRDSFARRKVNGQKYNLGPIIRFFFSFFIIYYFPPIECTCHNLLTANLFIVAEVIHQFQILTRGSYGFYELLLCMRRLRQVGFILLN